MKIKRILLYILIFLNFYLMYDLGYKVGYIEGVDHAYTLLEGFKYAKGYFF